MGKEDLAHVSALLALALVFSLFWPTGAGNAASHFLASSRAVGRSPLNALRTIDRSFLIAISAIVVVGVPISILTLGVDVLGAVGFGALVVAYSGYILCRGIEIGLGRFSRAAVWDLISATTALITLAAVLVVHRSELLLWPLVIGYAVFCLNTWLRAHRGHQDLDDRQLFSSGTIVRFTWVNSLGLLASNGLIQLAMVWVFASEQPAEAGLFAAAMSLATPASMLSQAISQALIPRFSEWAAVAREHARGQYAKVLGVLTLLLVVVFGAVFLASPLIIRVIYGHSYIGAAALMQQLLVGVFAFSVGLVANAFLITSGRAGIATVISGIGLVAGLVSTLIFSALLAPGFGATLGVVVGYTVAAIGLVGWSLWSKMPEPEAGGAVVSAGVPLVRP